MNHLNECSICLEAFEFGTAFITPCGHIFHKSCIQRLSNNNRNYQCPLCRVMCEINDEKRPPAPLPRPVLARPLLEDEKRPPRPVLPRPYYFSLTPTCSATNKSGKPCIYTIFPEEGVRLCSYHIGNTPRTTCKVILKSGPRKGLSCDKLSFSNGDCWVHTKARFAQERNNRNF